jgi:hypothetical protein
MLKFDLSFPFLLFRNSFILGVWWPPDMQGVFLERGWVTVAK